MAMHYGPVEVQRLVPDTDNVAELDAFAESLVADAKTLPSGDARTILMMLYGGLTGDIRKLKGAGK